MNLAGIIISISLACLACVGISFFILNLIKNKYVSNCFKTILILIETILFIFLVTVLSVSLKQSYDENIKHAYYHGVSIKREVHFDNQNNIEKVDTIFYIKE